jgi:hypothetical protein
VTKVARKALARVHAMSACGPVEALMHMAPCTAAVCIPVRGSRTDSCALRHSNCTDYVLKAPEHAPELLVATGSGLQLAASCGVISRGLKQEQTEEFANRALPRPGFGLCALGGAVEI